HLARRRVPRDPRDLRALRWPARRGAPRGRRRALSVAPCLLRPAHGRSAALAGAVARRLLGRGRRDGKIHVAGKRERHTPRPTYLATFDRSVAPRAVVRAPPVPRPPRCFVARATTDGSPSSTKTTDRRTTGPTCPRTTSRETRPRNGFRFAPTTSTRSTR